MAFLHHLCFSEFSHPKARSFAFLHAVTCFLCAVFMETKHVLWQVHSFVLPNYHILVMSFCIPSLPRYVSSLPIKKAGLIRCLNVAANFRRCYFSDDRLFSIIIIKQRKSGCATSVRCESDRSDLVDKSLLNAYVQQSCLQNATAVQGSCSPVDISCLCSSALYANTLGCCLSRNCNQADQDCMRNLRELPIDHLLNYRKRPPISTHKFVGMSIPTSLSRCLWDVLAKPLQILGALLRPS